MLRAAQVKCVKLSVLKMLMLLIIQQWKTSILNRMCAPLCDAVLQDDDYPAQTLLDNIQQANLFLVPLDNERHWYRYHYLFADLLHQRLLRESTGFSTEDVNELHTQASIWYETNGLELECVGRFAHLFES